VQKKKLTLTLNLRASDVNLVDGFSRDVSRIGHWGTGDVEVYITDMASIERAKPLIERSYEMN
jgi:predicted transport protein